MSQELLKALVDVIDDLMLRKKLSEEDAINISDSVLVRAEIAIESYLAQPEQEPDPLLAETKIEWYGKGFRQGVNEFALPKPLTEDVIYALDKEGIVENMDDHQVRYVIRWIRSVEKAHGIGGGL